MRKTLQGCLVVGALIAMPMAAATADEHVFKKGSAIIDCTCTVGQCGIETGHQSHNWSTAVFTPDGKIDLDQLCYHRQKKDDLGGVSCCDFGKNNTIGTHTTGKLGKECPGIDDPAKCH